PAAATSRRWPRPRNRSSLLPSGLETDCDGNLRAKRRGPAPHTRSKGAMEAISRLIPSPGNATVKIASEPEGCTEITVPTPNFAWRTFSPEAKLRAAFPALDAPEAAEAPKAP